MICLDILHFFGPPVDFSKIGSRQSTNSVTWQRQRLCSNPHFKRCLVWLSSSEKKDDQNSYQVRNDNFSLWSWVLAIDFEIACNCVFQLTWRIPPGLHFGCGGRNGHKEWTQRHPQRWDSNRIPIQKCFRFPLNRVDIQNTLDIQPNNVTWGTRNLNVEVISNPSIHA